MHRLLLSLLVSLALVCCRFGRPMEPVYTDRLSISPTRPMLAARIARPLYIVLDPERVPDEYTIPERTVKEIRILTIREFVRRDLRRAMGSVFEQVEIVAPGEPVPPEALIGEVEIQRFDVEVDMAVAGGYRAGRIYGQMGWAFGIKRPGERQFTFSYADSVTGTFALTNAQQTAEMMESTYRLAIERLFVEMIKTEVLQRFEA